jgi:hypothetical protein
MINMVFSNSPCPWAAAFVYRHYTCTLGQDVLEVRPSDASFHQRKRFETLRDHMEGSLQQHITKHAEACLSQPVCPSPASLYRPRLGHVPDRCGAVD